MGGAPTDLRREQGRDQPDPLRCGAELVRPRRRQASVGRRHDIQGGSAAGGGGENGTSINQTPPCSIARLTADPTSPASTRAPLIPKASASFRKSGLTSSEPICRPPKKRS